MGDIDTLGKFHIQKIDQDLKAVCAHPEEEESKFKMKLNLSRSRDASQQRSRRASINSSLVKIGLK